MADRILDVPEAATFLRVSPSTVLRNARTGRIPGRKLGARWLFSQAKLEEWVAAGMAPKGRESDPDPMPRPRRSRLADKVASIEKARAA